MIRQQIVISGEADGRMQAQIETAILEAWRAGDLSFVDAVEYLILWGWPPAEAWAWLAEQAESL